MDGDELVRVVDSSNEMTQRQAVTPQDDEDRSPTGERVLETFFGGSLEEALAAHLVARKDGVSAAERDRLVALIEQSGKEGR